MREKILIREQPHSSLIIGSGLSRFISGKGGEVGKEIFRKMHRALTVIEHWRLFRMRGRLGINPDFHIMYNQPWLHALGINTILDIGAHDGTVARTMKDVFPKASICCFEPIPQMYEQLLSRTRGMDGIRCFNMGLGEASGSMPFNLNAFSASSSMLQMAPKHVEAFPFTADSRQINVEIKRLDDVANELVLKPGMLIKVDVQGYEGHVIAGGIETFRKARVVIMEVSFVHLYDRQPLFGEINASMSQLGFRFAGLMDQLRNPKDGQILQGDAIFINASSIRG